MRVRTLTQIVVVLFTKSVNVEAKLRWDGNAVDQIVKYAGEGPRRPDLVAWTHGLTGLSHVPHG